MSDPHRQQAKHSARASDQDYEGASAPESIMLEQARKRLSFANTVAVIALFVALGGTSMAEPVRDGAGELATQAASAVGIGSSARKTAKRALRVAKRADRNAREALKRTAPGGANGTNGTAGVKGDRGDAGAAGAAATSLWAAVNSNGTLARSAGVFDVARISQGNYKVYFDRNVRSCSYQVTGGGTLTFQPQDLGAQLASAAADVNLLNGVSVGLRNSLDPSQAIDFPFHIAVFC